VSLPATHAGQRDRLVAFLSQYSEFVEVISDAVHYGPTPSLEGRYADLRSWLQDHYRDLRPLIDTHLAPCQDPTGLSGSRTDPFEVVWGVPTLDRLVNVRSDLMARLDWTRRAVEASVADPQLVH